MLAEVYQSSQAGGSADARQSAVVVHTTLTALNEILDRQADECARSATISDSLGPIRGQAPALRPAAAARAAAPATHRPLSEAARQAAIENLRLPGTDAAVDAAKANPSITPDMAAPSILAAYRRAHGLAVPAVHTPRAPAATVRTGDEARADWRASAALQAEFPSAESYAGYQAGIATGRIRPWRGAADAPPAPTGTSNFVQLRETWRAEWSARADLQRDFASADSYAKYAEAVTRGRVKVYGGCVLNSGSPPTGARPS